MSFTWIGKLLRQLENLPEGFKQRIKWLMSLAHVAYHKFYEHGSCCHSTNLEVLCLQIGFLYFVDLTDTSWYVDVYSLFLFSSDSFVSSSLSLAWTMKFLIGWLTQRFRVVMIEDIFTYSLPSSSLLLSLPLPLLL